MAESSSEKTEKATPQKIRDAKKKGQVPNSKDIPGALILLTATIYLWVMGDWMLVKMTELYMISYQLPTLPFKQALSAALRISLEIGLYAIVLPFVGLAAVMGILGNIVQFGILFSFDPVIPRLSKVNPGEGFKRIFSMKQFVNTLLSLVKTLAIALALYIVMHVGFFQYMNEIKQCDIPCQKEITVELLTKLMMMILPLIITLATLDYIFQKIQFEKDQRMTKEEIKREMKDAYGDPHIRGARQGMRRELTEQDIHSRIKTARLVIIDIGLAVALYYEQDVTPLPVIVAIGKAGMARKMIEIAQIENVPIISDARLIADLIEEGKIDQYIPASTIDRVAKAMRNNNKR
ncbi:EscU/YscU/HrcU family type III secretion system export apparatus switch protein [uncultured Thiothrix sp.]|uniref:EscU/YscU/HrcU family type III secretion system export apparatus switch protein n=1 Tax=uncultured Thiothrix sp. TaxID=223185 RepID=UPI00260F9ED0|nr:EscU/YscU/HrcU family type III secretion system export apparatus switch protein [uncultured Thiothrix sp.]HMT92186.1 EscU/YscU/HrcU family type III secretion system export apparatus switch protein [Thiolinea sp.]